MLPEGTGGYTPSRPAPKPTPRPVEKYAPSYNPQYVRGAPVAGATGSAPSAFTDFFSGAASTLNPVEQYRSWRRDPLQGLKMFSPQGQQEMGDDLVAGFQDNPAKAAGALAPMLLPLMKGVPRPAPNLAARAAGYPTGRPPATRYPLQNMGKHAGFDRTTARQLEVMKAPPMAEHIKNLDNARMIEHLAKGKPYMQSDHAPTAPDWAGGRPVAPYNATQAYNHPEGFFFDTPKYTPKEDFFSKPKQQSLWDIDKTDMAALAKRYGMEPGGKFTNRPHNRAFAPQPTLSALKGKLAGRGMATPSEGDFFSQILPMLMQGSKDVGGTSGGYPGSAKFLWGGPR